MNVTDLFDTAAERALLAGCITDPKAIDRVSSLVVEGDFGDVGYGKMFSALVLLRDSGRPIGDPVLLLSDLKDLSVPESVVSFAFITRLIQEGVSGHERHYAGRVRKLSLLRRLLLLADRLRERGSDPASDPADVAEWATVQLESLAGEQDTGATTIHAAGLAVLTELDEAAKRQGQRGAMTGLPTMDERHGGWMPGDLVILAARPGVGKTSLALQIAVHNAERDRPVLFVSLEMTATELALRKLCADSQVDGRRVRTGVVDDDERDSLRRAVADLEHMGIAIWDKPSTLARIRGVARCHNATKPLGLVVVDYIGLVVPEDHRAPRHEQVGRVSRGLKNLAKEIGVPVLALAQLNREADGERPRLSNLRDSGSLEQDADVVWLLHRPNEHGDALELLQEKHRHSTRDTLDLQFIGRETRFEESSPEPDASLSNWSEGSEHEATR